MANTTLRAYLNDLKALLEREALEEVIGHCRHIIQHFPKNIEAYRTLGSALLERGRRAEAADVFQRVLGAVPDDFTAHIGLGSAYEESNVGAAVWHLERALEQEPTHQALQDELSRLLTVRDGAAPAAFNLTRGALARVYLKSQLYNQAIIELQGALQQNNERIDLAVLLGRTLWMSGHPVEASEVALQILRTYPDNVEANRIMAALWLAMGRPSDSEPFIARLEQLDPFLAWETLHPDGTPVPRDAFQLPRLQWDARTAAAMDSSLPDWVSTIGDVFEAQDEAAAALGTPGVGPIVSPWGDEEADSAAEFAPSPGEGADAFPDWLNDVVEPEPEPPLAQASSTVADAFADYTPEWLGDEETPIAADPFADLSGATAIEDALDWLQTSPMPGAPSGLGVDQMPGATDELPPIEEFDVFQAQAPAQPEVEELPQDFAEDAFPWLNTATLPTQDTGASSAPSAPRGRMPGETGPLTMLQPPSGGAAPPPPAEAQLPAVPELDEDALAWLQTGSLPAPDSEPAPALDFSAFEADLDSAGGALTWLEAGDLADTAPSLETSAEFLGDIEANTDLWASGPDATEGAALADGEATPGLELAFDSAWLTDLSGSAETPTSAGSEIDEIQATEPEISLDFAALAGNVDELADMAPPDSGDWLSELGAAPGDGPIDTAPDLDLQAWTVSASESELPLDLAPASEIPGWLNELRQGGPATGSDAGDHEIEAPPAGTPLGEEISLESLDLGWLRSESPHLEGSADAGLGPLGGLFLDDEAELAAGAAEMPASAPVPLGEAPAAYAEPAEFTAPEDAAAAGEQEDMMAWMRQVGILQEQQAEALPELPIDEDLLASAALLESEGAAEPASQSVAPESVPTQSSVTQNDVLAFLRSSEAAEADDLYARMNRAEAVEADAQASPAAPAAPPVSAFSAPLPTADDTVLEEDFLAAFEVGVSSAPRDADTDDWLGTLAKTVEEPLGDDWLGQISRSAPVRPMEEPAPVDSAANQSESPAAHVEPAEDIPLWQRPAVTASLAQASAAMDMFDAEEPLVAEDDIPAWMREAADELLVSPTDSTPIASEDQSSSRGLLSFTPQADMSSPPRMDTGILEPDRTPEWLSVLSSDVDVVPEAEAETVDVQPDWLDATGADDAAGGATVSYALPSTETPESYTALEPEAGAAAELGVDWLDNVLATEDRGLPQAAAPLESVLDAEPDFEQPVAGDIPAWMQEMGLTPPSQSPDSVGQEPVGRALTPLEELDFSALELGAVGSEPEGSKVGPAEPFDFLADLGAPPGEPVAKATDLADTTAEVGAAASDNEPELPEEAAPATRFSFQKDPAWKRKRQGSDGAP